MLSMNKVAYTRACLDSLLATEEVELEVVVVDNGSDDGSVEMLEIMTGEFDQAGHTLRYRANEQNVGCCTGRNQALEMSTGEYCVFMDNDIMAVDAGWAVGLRSVLQEEPEAGLVGPKLIYPFTPHRIQCAGVGISPHGRVQFRGRNCERDTPEFAEREEVQCLISACCMFPRQVYEEIGGMDEAFNPIEFEDFDWCYRAREAGYRALYEPSVEMYHWESITSEGTARLPNTYLIVKHGMLFKKRWQHMFSQEDGPADEECRWERIEVPSLDGPRAR
jgi:GT2 family glycosyltransferase